jgi:hypothetical protein
MSFQLLMAQANLHQEMRHHECVKRIDINDEKSLVIILKRFDTDTLHQLPAFYDGFKVYHKVEGEEQPKKITTPKKKEEKKRSTGEVDMKITPVPDKISEKR